MAAATGGPWRRSQGPSTRWQLEPDPHARAVAASDAAILLRILNYVRIVELVRIGQIRGIRRQDDILRDRDLESGVELVIAVAEFGDAGLRLRDDEIPIAPCVGSAQLQRAFFVK